MKAKNIQQLEAQVTELGIATELTLGGVGKYTEGLRPRLGWLTGRTHATE